MAEIVEGILHLPENPTLTASVGILDPDTLSKEERAALIKENPAYGNIICRCEMVTEGEILGCTSEALGLDPRRGQETRAGMGRCQAGFCTPRTMELLHRWHSHDGDHKIRRGVQTPCGNQ